MDHLPLFSEDYLFSRWENDFVAYRNSDADSALRTLLKHWMDRDASLTETQLEAQFVDRFFRQVWGYWGTGERERNEGFCLNSQYGVDGAGQTGGKGTADLALGWWGFDDSPSAPQVLAEFKDIRSGLDVPQRRKGNTRSPVKQCLDYLKHAFDAVNIRSPVFPTWGIVTNMNEFRLYYRKAGDEFCQRFIIKTTDSREVSLLDDGEAALRRRFLFQKIFRRELLIAKHGKNGLAALLDGQIVREQELEKGFYREYQEYREFVFAELVAANHGFIGTRGKLVKLTQRFLDRCIFILFCENMGQALSFPSDLLRDMLMRESCAPTYSGNFDNIWSLVKQLFRTMRDGGPFPPDHSINRFNGGLFEDLPELENLVIPNRVFCAKMQGGSPEAIDRFPKTLLYLSARYNYGAHGAARERTITLYALGRIFEQSITDLEYMEAEVEGKRSLAALTKRKRDGVYYTPEWVTGYIVRETLGTKLAEIRAKLGLELGESLPSDEVSAYRKYAGPKTGKSLPKPVAKMAERMNRLNAYEQAMNALKVLDPACGSGAFLIQTLRFLLREQRAIAEERERITGTSSLFDRDVVMRSILAHNLYGVDINPESVEITQLALWLHTALPEKPLSNLEHHIRCGNSLIGSEFEAFYQAKHPKALFADLNEQERENVNVFDWAEAFPEVLGEKIPPEKRGFDCIVGNPPYVKLQRFRTLKPDESDFYIESREANKAPRYESAQTGNFDLYLLFIEKGVSLLNGDGCMGFIAPNLWLKNEYGQGLREKVKRTRSLDRWIDFKSFQIFEGATTYTALQFFSRKPNDAIRFFFAPDGDIAPVDWSGPTETLGYDELPDDAAWNLISRQERQLICRLRKECETLEQASSAITVGIQTSADLIYHLRRLKPGKYAQIGGKADGKEYDIEDAIVHPLVSGPAAKRYQLPDTVAYLLFPYSVNKKTVYLFDKKEMASRFPKAWTYLRKHEKELRGRERGMMDRDDGWWGYNYPKNLDKQELSKLLVPRLASSLFCVGDEKGSFYLDNVDVGGVIPASKADLWFLCGILNAPVCDFVFRKTSKPFRGGYLSANKQYIAPLPIPRASTAEKGRIGQRAKKLQALHTTRRNKTTMLQRRLDASQCVDDHREPEWLWADVKTIAKWKAVAPENLSAREKTAWAKAEYENRLIAYLEPIDAALVDGTILSVAVNDGEIRFLADSIPVASAYADKDERLLIAAQWRQIARRTHVTERFSAKRLVDSLLALRTTSQSALRKQIIQIDAEIQSLEQKIHIAESELNATTYRLYKLSPEEIKLVEKV